MRALLIVCAVALFILIGWAAYEAPFLASFGAIISDPWGIVALADLYLGFVLFGLVIALTEPSRPVAVLLIAALFVLGNVVAAIWLVVRWRRLQAKLRDNISVAAPL
ncbi:hypothetical protein [Amorphus coralli]|uniref:hypothetical protein n=1 Tax=Amorphus coralli TaxID=340680 RepID=UPI000381C5A4|nr:hypothetical protein [Amorphus coralli]